jgi:hypothetical protein
VIALVDIPKPQMIKEEIKERKYSDPFEEAVMMRSPSPSQKKPSAFETNNNLSIG